MVFQDGVVSVGGLEVWICLVWVWSCLGWVCLAGESVIVLHGFGIWLY